MLERKLLIERAMKRTIMCEPMDAKITPKACKKRYELAKKGIDAKQEAKRDIYRAFINVETIISVVQCLDCPRAKRYY